MNRLEIFLAGRGGVAVALAWGWAEATGFFLVPDVWLTLIACFRPRAALRASVAALIGALAGGTMMVLIGSHVPERARAFLVTVPGIRMELVERVRAQLDADGLRALLLGPARGIPYKIYAVEWGARHGGLLAFVLTSIPARYVRFVLTVLVAGGIAAFSAPRIGRRAVLALWAAFWLTFYAGYFRHMGW